jgi:hypothetical protein
MVWKTASSRKSQCSWMRCWHLASRSELGPECVVDCFAYIRSSLQLEPSPQPAPFGHSNPLSPTASFLLMFSIHLVPWAQRLMVLFSRSCSLCLVPLRTVYLASQIDDCTLLDESRSLKIDWYPISVVLRMCVLFCSAWRITSTFRLWYLAGSNESSIRTIGIVKFESR